MPDDYERFSRVVVAQDKLLRHPEARSESCCSQLRTRFCTCWAQLVTCVVLVLTLLLLKFHPYLPETAAGWKGPRWRGELLWGGPPVGFAQRPLVMGPVPMEAVEKAIRWAGADSDVPEGLKGIFWMDQAGNSSVAKNPSYGFHFEWSPEVLIGFATGGDDEVVFEKDTRCLTPIPFYGGKHVIAVGGGYGKKLFSEHYRNRNTLSFCFEDESYTHIRIYQKQLTEELTWGPMFVGSKVAQALGLLRAGGNYTWLTENLLDMRMVKAPHGWDRNTYLVGTGDVVRGIEALGGSYAYGKLAARYPVLQVVDAQGQRTQYWEEFLEAAKGYPSYSWQFLIAA